MATCGAAPSAFGVALLVHGGLIDLETHRVLPLPLDHSREAARHDVDQEPFRGPRRKTQLVVHRSVVDELPGEDRGARSPRAVYRVAVPLRASEVVLDDFFQFAV